MAEYLVHASVLNDAGRAELCDKLDVPGKSLANQVLPRDIRVTTYNRWRLEYLAALPPGVTYDVLVPPPV